MRKTTKNLTIHRETLRLMTDPQLARAAAAAVPTGVTNCPVQNTRICCTLVIACVG